jgi:pimeloyl-ACP methyl ester carboxylesterase
LDGRVPTPELFRSEPDGASRGVVLMLHGGAKTGTEAVAEGSASFWRTSRMRDAIRPRIHEAGLSLWLLRFGVRGWNLGLADEPSPVPDARWALEQVAREHAGLPVVLLGHSMGARTAVHAADHPDVVGVVGLAPWLEPGDPVAALTDRHVIAGHGSRDRITSARMTRKYVDRARDVSASADFVDMGRLGHYMLAHPGRWNRFAVEATLDVLGRAEQDRAGNHAADVRREG